MGPSESDRLRLFETARRSWGDEAAATLMDLLPPLDWSQIATKQDLAELRSELRTEIADLRSEVHLRFAEHTRTIVLAVVGSNVALVGLTFVAARFA
jgi:hypothetical protein